MMTSMDTWLATSGLRLSVPMILFYLRSSGSDQQHGYEGEEAGLPSFNISDGSHLFSLSTWTCAYLNSCRKSGVFKQHK
jgi:hypothetical protein